MNAIRKRALPGMVAALLASTTVMGACSTGNEGKTGENGKAEAPTEISIMLTSMQPTPPQEDNEVILELEKRTGTDLRFQWVSGNYTDKANVIQASGELPDMMLVQSPDIFGNVFQSMSAQGAYWDISSYITDYPNLSKLPASVWDKLRMDGAIYGVPRPRSTEGASFFLIRQDWLDTLGLDMPTTSDELLEVMRAFTHEDPDRNGKDDTIGFVGDMQTFGPISNIFTKASGTFGSLGAKWKLQDGELVHTSLLPSMREALLFGRQLVQEKLVPEDIATIKGDQTKNWFISGKAGMKIDKIFTSVTYLADLEKIDPKAELVGIPQLNDFNPQDLGFNGMFAISKKVPEAKLKKVLEFLDYTITDEAYELQQWGIKDVHYTEENGVKTRTDQYATDSLSDLNQIIYKNDKYANAISESMSEEVKEQTRGVIDEKEKTSVPDYSYGLHSETNLTAGVELDKKIEDMKTKVVLGMEPIEAWDAFAAELATNTDLKKITQEINDSYKKRIGQ